MSRFGSNDIIYYYSIIKKKSCSILNCSLEPVVLHPKCLFFTLGYEPTAHTKAFVH